MQSFKEFLNTYDEVYSITEGGSSGHMETIFTDMSLSFSDIKTLINDVLSGKIELHEKSDGQQLSVTFKDGQLKASRNKTTLKNPMTIDEVAAKFAGRGPIKDAFVNSMRDVQSAVMTLSDEERTEIFNNGQNHMAFEIIYPPTKNVVNYGNKALIQFHGVNLYNEKWKKIGEDKSLAKKLFKLLKAKNALNQKVFEITGPAILKLDKDFSDDIPKYIKKLSKIQGKIKDNQTLRDWFIAKWTDYLEDTLDSTYDKILDNETIMNYVVNRWAFQDKSYSKVNLVKDILEIVDAPIEDIRSWFTEMDKNAPNINKDIVMPLELFTIELGGQLLNNVSGLISANPDMTVKDMRKDLDDAVKTIKVSDVESAKAKLAYNLSKIEQVGYDKIAPTEGIVVMYKGKPLKLTGTFGATNALIGLFKYGKLP